MGAAYAIALLVLSGSISITQQPSTSLNNPQHHSTTLNITQQLLMPLDAS